MKQPVDHIIRPRLPWRSAGESDITECGYDASKVKALTRDEFFQRLKDYGQQRTALLTCMTCSDTAKRWKAWEEDPRTALEREINWECGWRRTDRGERLLGELVAIAALIEAHRDEFAGLLAENEQRRAWLEKKAEMQRKPKQPATDGTSL